MTGRTRAPIAGWQPGASALPAKEALPPLPELAEVTVVDATATVAELAAAAGSAGLDAQDPTIVPDAPTATGTTEEAPMGPSLAVVPVVEDPPAAPASRTASAHQVVTPRAKPRSTRASDEPAAGRGGRAQITVRVGDEQRDFLIGLAAQSNLNQSEALLACFGIVAEKLQAHFAQARRPMRTPFGSTFVPKIVSEFAHDVQMNFSLKPTDREALIDWKRELAGEETSMSIFVQVALSLAMDADKQGIFDLQSLTTA